MEQLLWSIEPKSKVDERRTLAATVPGLVKRLAAGLKAAGVEDAVAARFFTELMKRHTEVIGTIGKEKAETPVETAGSPPAPVSDGKTAPAIPPAPLAPVEAKQAAGQSAPASKQTVPPAPARPTAPMAPVETKQVAGQPAPPSKQAMPPAPAKPPVPPVPSKAPQEVVETLDFTAAITVRNPFGAGEVKVEELDFTAGAAAGPVPATGPGRTKRGSSDTELTDKLVEGKWVEIQEKNPDSEEVTSRPSRLSYVSPHKTRYLFVDRQGKTVLECSRAEIARRLRLKEAVVMDEAPLFDRIMGGLLGKLRAPAPSH